MVSGIPTVDGLSTVINHATAPAFLLGAVAAFVAILITRLNRVLDRTRELASSENLPDDAVYTYAGLVRRADFINKALVLAVASGIMTMVSIITGFAFAVFNFEHEIGVALWLSAALASLAASLIYMIREINLAMRAKNHFV